MRAIAAQAQVRAPVQAVWALLDDLREHWLLADRWTEVHDIDADGGIIRLRGPAGLRRTVRVRVTRRAPARELEGLAQLGSLTSARVLWELDDAGRGRTRVRLTAEVLAAGSGDRLLLALGARRWLRWRFGVTLTRLDERLAGGGDRGVDGAAGRHDPMSTCVTPGTFPPSVRGEDPGERTHRRNRLLWPREP